MTQHTYPSAEAAIQRITDLADNPEEIEAVHPMGDDDLYWYYVVVQIREYQGNQYLNERYVQLVKPDLPEGEEDRVDTFKTNGINRLVEGRPVSAEADNLRRMYDVVSRRVGAKERGNEMPAPAYLER